MTSLLTQMGSKNKYTDTIKNILQEYNIEYDVIIEPFAGTASFSLSHLEVAFIVNDKFPFNMLLFYALGYFSYDANELAKEIPKSRDEFVIYIGENKKLKTIYDNLVADIWDREDFLIAKSLLSDLLAYQVANNVEDIRELSEQYFKIFRDKFPSMEKSFPFSSMKTRKLFSKSLVYPILLFNKFSYGGVLRCNKDLHLNIPCRYNSHELPRSIFNETRMTYFDFVIYIYKISFGTLSVGDYKELMKDFAHILGDLNVLFFLDPPYLPEEGTAPDQNKVFNLFFNNFTVGDYEEMRDICLDIKKENTKNHFVICHSLNEEISRIFSKGFFPVSYNRAPVHLGTSKENSEHEYVECLYITK